jgi:hypothetical protein
MPLKFEGRGYVCSLEAGQTRAVTVSSGRGAGDLQGRGVAFLSMTEAIDTTSAAGRLIGNPLNLRIKPIYTVDL